MDQKKRILFLDVDGTLLYKEYDTNPLVWSKIHELESSGIVVSLVTARPYPFSEYLINQLDTHTFHMFDRGAFITSKIEQGLSVALPSIIVNKVLDLISPDFEKIRIGLSKEKIFYVNKNYKTEIDGYIKSDNFKSLTQISSYEGVNSVWLRDVPVKYQQTLMMFAKNKYHIRTSPGRNPALVDIFINSKISQKDTFINMLAKLNGVDLKQSIGVGDSLEDLPFLLLSEVVACPQNASLEVKNISNYVAKQKYSDGLLEILNKMF